MRIANNIMAMNAHRQLVINQGGIAKSIEKLSSGLRINRAGDDAAGLAISEKMRGQIRGLRMAAKNAQDAISLIQTAEGALNETHAILQRMRELAVQAASDTNTNADRAELQKEVDELAIELTRIANNTEFNTQTLLNGAIQADALGELGFHIGANEGQFIKLSIAAMDAHSLGVARDRYDYSATVQGIVDRVTFANVVGSGVVDGANVELSFTAATAAEIQGTNAVQAANLSTLGGGATIEITIDGNIYVVDNATLVNWNGSQSVQDMVDAIQTAIGGAGTVDLDGGNLRITSASTGSQSAVEITFTGTSDDISALQGAFGINSGTVGQGTDAFVTLEDTSNGVVQNVTVLDPSASTLKVEGGEFQGITIELQRGRALQDLDPTADSFSISAKVTRSSSARFDNKQKLADAVAAAGIDISSRETADKAISVIQGAIDKVSAERSKLGAYQNRLEHTIANLGVSAENLQAAESRIRDVDMAQEMMNFTKYQILQQASTAMLAQANLAPQSVLQLLG